MQATVPNIHTTTYGSRVGMRVSNAVHESRPWRIREIAPDFTVEDVWALPVEGGAGDFQTLLEVMASGDPAHGLSLPARVLVGVRWRLGRWFGWAGPASAPPIPGTNAVSLTGRPPAGLRATPAGAELA